MAWGGVAGVSGDELGLLIRLTRFDPNDGTKLGLDVDGKYKCGSPLGLAVLDDRNNYSEHAPEVIEGNGNAKPGPRPEAINKAQAFILDGLVREDRAGLDLLKRRPPRADRLGCPPRAGRGGDTCSS